MYVVDFGWKAHKVETKLRAVAHSLGCKLLINALEQIDASERPDEIHLCAAAYTETEFPLFVLQKLAKDHTYVYYSMPAPCPL